MSKTTKTRIKNIQVWPVNISITEPFTISKGEMKMAENIFVRITLTTGTHGYGEIAPFPALTNETQDNCLAMAKSLLSELVGLDVLEYRAISAQFETPLALYPSVRCGLETAVLDALCREIGIPLWALWGGAAVKEYETDITIPIRTVSETLTIARDWYQQGFRIFKLKVGEKIEDDIETLSAFDNAFDDISLIVDANQGYSVKEARLVAQKLESLHARIITFEQPVDRHDIAGMADITKQTSIPIAADESVFTVEDARRVIKERAANLINLKITKSGLFPTVDIVTLCHANNMPLMIGGMLETRIAMGCSFSLVLGLGGITILDLDTPLLMADDPLQLGGYSYKGSRLVPWRSAGLGLVPREEPEN
ncbi:MAG: dipeptide epimerase [Nitrospirales bacterium]|nr:MAG: dipeptide epimerase [Nitrospirales bacterium]